MKLKSILLILFVTVSAQASTIAEYTKDMQHTSGFFDFYWDNNTGRILLQVTDLDKDFLYVNFLQSGIGSNDIGLDRGQIGNQRLVKFKRFGNKILLFQPNLEFRAISDNPLERKAVEDAFAQSVLLGAEILAQSNHAYLIDISDFLLRDSHDISTRLSAMKQGQYKLDKGRSVIYMENSKSFPDNTEFEALITLQGTKPGQYIQSVTPTSEIISLRTHHSFVRLPETPYAPRKFDPRSGAFPISYEDYAAPLGQSLTQKFITRHRLIKKNPELTISDPIKPIIYYLDPGTPEPMRSALIEGASWWAQGFLAAGFSHAFEVKLLPKDADPLDIRYNTIQWVHRSTRGWSYGASIIDPRTGEILKGHVSLGSLRVRQDMLIAQGLLSPFHDGIKQDKRIQEMALARLRQLAAHEVGHTLGFAHNYSASTVNRDSVMDYPHPLIKINNDKTLDLSDAYAVGLGEWDKIAVKYSYSHFDKNEDTQLTKILKNAADDGHVFITDRDARSQGGSHPSAHLWDNGAEPIQALNDVLAVRKIALENFGLNTIKQGQTLFSLEQILTPIYLFHRYQVEAVVKLIAGVNYRYAIKGEVNVENHMVSGKQQLMALNALMQTLQAEQLAVPEHILKLLSPPAFGDFRNREHFKSRTGLNFDALGAAEVATQIPLKLIFNPQRANRLVEQQARNHNIPSLGNVIDVIIENTWKKKHSDSYHQAVQDSINSTVLHELMNLTASEELSLKTKAICMNKLDGLAQSLKRNKSPLAKQAVRIIHEFFENNKVKKAIKPLKIPPGSPIGM